MKGRIKTRDSGRCCFASFCKTWGKFDLILDIEEGDGCMLQALERGDRWSKVSV
jgi:hypothetical protein